MAFTSRSGLTFSIEKVPITARVPLEANTTPTVFRWQAKPLTNARNAASARVGHFLYLSGFFARTGTSSGSVISTIPVLDIPRKSWRWIKRCKGPASSGARMFLFDDALYLLSSVGYRECTNYGSELLKVSRFDLLSEEWYCCHATGQTPGRRSFFSGNYLEGLARFVVFGGIGTGTGTLRTTDNDVYLLSMPRREWTKAVAKGNPPEIRWEHGSCEDKGVIYIFGGMSRTGLCDGRIFVLELLNQGKVAQWSTPRATSSVVPRLLGSVCVAFNGVVMMLGGCDEDGAHGITLFDPAKREFERVNLAEGLDSIFGEKGTAFLAENGKAIAVLGGNKLLDYYIRVAVES